jgi:hypothetical protein|tara:strand:- start:143 stop:409 length:267 start_codon:yes stop_codon:yes gene_type:complete
MDINTFLKAYTLFINKSGNEDIKDTDVMVSDINHNNTITESTWLSMCEWRALKNGVLDIADKSSKVTWAALSALETEAKAVSDNPNPS